ncbi:putative Retinol dehydrogenase 11 [Fasciola hepatica]|uniref:Retinol dehydrogenase 11 n=1 Tax=Fasciola hepatica TaxID=6192 RepID=A0A4E0RL51_FASHE|nr:putative Retinol dehydrogenase 11 [Fasciola hepatica]
MPGNKDKKGCTTKYCIISKRLTGKTAIVTGANTGIGFHTAGELARRGALVIMACRNEERAKAAKTKLLSLYSESNADCMKTDVADRRVVDSLKPIKADQRLMFGLLRPMTISAWEGAQTTLYTVLMDSPTPGGYYSNCALKAANRLVNDERERQWLWEKSCELVGLPKN